MGRRWLGIKVVQGRAELTSLYQNFTCGGKGAILYSNARLLLLASGTQSADPQQTSDVSLQRKARRHW